MKKQLSLLMLIVALMVPWALEAQTVPVSVFPYSCDFEDASESAEWILVNGTYANQWVIDTAVNNTTAGSKALYVSNDNGASTSYTKNAAEVVYAYRELDLMPGEYSVTFDWKCHGESTYDYILAAVVPSSVTLTASGTLPTGVTYSAMTAAGWQNIGPRDQQYIKMNLNGSTWTTQNSFFSVATAGTYKLVFVWRNDGSGGTDPAGSIDNISVATVACPRPIGLTLENLTFSGATVSWTALDGISSYRVYLSTQPDFSIDTCAYTTVNDTAYVLTGLDSLTNYYWTVAADCGSDGISAIDGIMQFTTLRDCGPGYYNINTPIGDGTSAAYTQFTYNSTSTSYNKGHSACIYTQDDLAEIGLEGAADIRSLSIHAGSTAAITPLRVYIGETALTEWGSAASDTTGLSNMMLVFDDTISSTAGEWLTIMFDSVFHYTGTGNLVVYFYRSGPPSANGTYYYTSTSPVYRSFYGYKSATSTANLSYTRSYNRMNIKFDMCAEEVTCTRPSDLTVATTETTATLNWTGCSSATEYLVTYGVIGGAATTVSASSETITIENLVPGMDYEFAVRSVCGDDTTFALTETGTTLCAELSVLPYVQSFEGAPTGSSSSTTFVNCMTRLNNGTTYFGHPYVGTTSSYNHTEGGTRGLYWGALTTTGTYGDYQVVVLPPVDTNVFDINTLQLRFWARATLTSYNVVFQVGVMTDPTDVNTFQLMQNITVGGNTTYTEYTVPFGTFDGYGQYVAIKAVRPASTWYATVDDITLELMPTCPPITDLEVSTTVGSALLTWDYQQGYSDPVGYVLTYDSIGGSNPIVLNSSTSHTLLTGLEAGTEYKVYVQADCGDEYGSMDSIEFSTKELDCLQLDPTTADTVIFSNSTSGQSGCLAYSSYGNTAYQAVWTAAELTAAGLSAGTIRGIDLGFTGCTTYNKEFTIFIGNTSTTSISSTTFEVPTEDMLVYGPANHPMNTSGWQHYDFTTPFNWDGVSSIIITTFMNQNGGSQTNSTGLTGYYVSAANSARYRYKDSNPFTLDNVATTGTASSTYTYRAAIHFYTGECMTEAVCAAPAMTLSDVTASSATLTWAPGYNETMWDVDYRIEGASEWTNAASAVSATTYTIDSLQAGTDYEFRVSFECNDDNTLYYAIAAARTRCMPVSLPYTYDFDDLPTGTSSVRPDITCWHHLNNGTSYFGYPYVSATTPHSGLRSLYWYQTTTTGTYGDYQVVVMPEVDTAVNLLYLSFWARPSSTSYSPVFLVGVMTDPEDIYTFETVDTIYVTSGSTEWGLYEVNLSSYTGNGRYIALRANRASTCYMYTDDFTIDYIPTCPHVTNLTVDSVTSNTITLSWNAGGTETDWAVTADNGFYAVTYDNTFTITGLDINTPYTVGVRALCDATDSSSLMTVNTRTACAEFMTLPYSENFDGYTASTTAATGVEIPCWTRIMTGTATYQTSSYLPQIYYSSTYAHTGDYSLRLYGVGYHVLPQLPIPANQVSMGFWSYTSSTSSYLMAVGVMTDPNDENTFDTVQIINYPAASTNQYFEIDFSSYTDTGRYIAFRNYNSSTSIYYSYHYLDDVQVWRNSTCPSPVVNVASVDYDNVTVAWADTSNTGYLGATVYWATVNDIQQAQDTTVTGVSSLNIGGLAPSTDYYIWVAANCTSEPSRPILVQARTTSACVPVEGLTVSGVDNSSFGISWQAPTQGVAPTAYVVWTRKCTNAPYSATATWQAVDTTTSLYYLFTGLDAATAYGAAVTTLCGNDMSEASVVYATTTICEMDTVGDYGTNYSAQPIYATQAFAYTQQIYLASELAGIDSISSLAIYQRGYDYTDRNITVYLGYTSKNEFATTSDYVPAANLTQVYSGLLSGFGWLNLNFDSVYVRNTDSNLVVAIDDNTGVVNPANCYWACTNYGSIYRALRYYGTSDVNPVSPSGSSARDYYRAYIVFGNAACEPNECTEPIVMQTASLPNSVPLAWNAQPGISYEVAYRMQGDVNWTVFNAANTTGTETITGLAPALQGEARVSYTCHGETVSGYVLFGTACGPAGLPLVEDFEYYDYGHFSRNCWITGLTDPLSADRDYPYVTSLTGSDDMICLLYYGGYMILPELSAPLDSLQIRFQVIQGGENVRLIMGLMTDATQPINTIYPLDTIIRSEIDPVNSEVTYTYQFGAIDTAYRHARIAFWDAFSDNYTFLDDIVVEYLPQCQPATDFTVTTTTTSATISWADDGINATSHMVEYGPRYFTPGTGAGIMVPTSTSSVTLTGLTHSTSYDAYVYTICDSVNATSVASQVIRFETECDVVTTLPYTVDFENIVPPGSSPADALPNCWGSEASGAIPHVIYTSTSSYVGSGSHSMEFTTLGVAALPAMSAPLNTLMISFRDYCASPTTDGLIIGTVTTADSGMTATFVPYDTVDFVTDASGIYNVRCYFNEYTGTASHIAIRNFSRNGSGTSTHYIDDVVVEQIPACIPPQHLHVDYMVGNEASLVWNRSNSSSYTVRYRVHTDTVFTTLTTSSSDILITGLTPQTQYDVEVFGDCDTSTVSFTTPCNTVSLPYFENFDSITTSTTSATGVHVGCWNYNMTGTATYQTATYQPQVYYSSTYANSGNYSLRLYGVANVMLPPMPTSLDSLQITFYPYKTSASYNLEIGIMEGDLFVPYQTIDYATSTHPEIVVKFNNYTGNSRIIAFRNSYGTYGYSYHYIDDVEVDYIPTCPKVDSLRLTNVTDNSVSLYWVTNGPETEWMVSYDTTNIIVYDTTPTITGLAPNTDYTFTVRPICAADDTGRVRIITAHTTCVPVTLPYTENFDNITTSTSTTNYGSVPDCWSYVMTGTASYQTGSYLPRVYHSSTYSNSGSYCYYMYGVGYHILPPMPTSLDSLELTFSRYFTSASYGLEVGVMEGTTFVPVETITGTTSTHADHTVYFGTYTGTSRTIAFRNYYTTSATTYYSGNYIDDIDVHYLPSCPRVLDVHSTASTMTSITVDWMDQVTANQWQLEYGSMGHSIGTGTLVNVSTHPYTISALDTLTNYDVYVRPICSVGDTGNWSLKATLSTSMCDNATEFFTGAATGTNNQGPVNNFYRHTLTETIIDSAELAGLGAISYIGYSYNYGTPTTDKTNVKIWFQPTNKTEFASNTDAVAVNPATAVKVYQGSLNCVQGWNYFPLDTTYIWDGHSNLLVIVQDNSGEYDGSAYVFDITSHADYKYLIYYRDGTAGVDTISAYNPSTFTSTNAYRYQRRPTMKLVSCVGVTCPSPVVANVTNDYQSATITVTGTGNGYELSFGTDPSALGNTVASTTGVFNISGLTPATQYFFEAVQICDSGDVSDPTLGTFTTDDLPCFTPTDLNVVATTFSSATLGWTSSGNATTWVVEIGGAGVQRFDTVGTNPYTVTGLHYNQQYTASVRAICLQGVVESPWSDTLTFRTDACAPVTGVAVTDITANSAKVGWQPASDAIAYNVFYGDSNFYDNEALTAEVPATATSYTMTGLEEESAYEVYVQTKCAEGVFSVVTAADRVSFRTTAGGSEGIYDAESGTLTLFPNPASTSVTVTVSGMEGDVTVEIVDLNGRTSGKWTVDSGKVELDLSGLSQGAYFVRVTGERQTVVRKLIVR